jgi:hypothetical protein
MTDEPLVALDITDLKPIQPSGFVPPSQRTGYSDPFVQGLLSQAFGGQFPRLESIEKNVARYRYDHPEEATLGDMAAARSIEDIPQAEAMRLLQGWITLRRIVMESTSPEGVRSLLMNLRIPDPRVAPCFYRVSDPPNGDRKLFILIGFEGPSAPSVTLEEGLAAMLDVKPSQLESLLATSIAPSKSAARETHPEASTANAAAPVMVRPPGSKNIALLCSSVALLLFALAIVWKLNERPSPSAPSLQIAATLQPVVPAPELPTVSSAPETIAPPGSSSASVPRSAPAPLPTLDAMNTGIPPQGAASHPTTQQTSDNIDLNLMVR